MSIGQPFCKHCNKPRLENGHDPCIGTLKGVMNACCGHGFINEAYVQFNHKDYDNDPNKLRIAGQEAINYILNNKPK